MRLSLILTLIGLIPSLYDHAQSTDMRSRAKEINGKLVIDSAPGVGTTIQLRLPIFEAED